MLKNQIKKFSIIGIVLSTLGLIDSIYLTIVHYNTSVPLACPETKFINCQKVTSSSYSMIGHIPITFFGIFFFLIFLILNLPVFWRTADQLIRLSRLIMISLGLVSVFYLVYVELYKLNSICLYCTGIHIIVFILFISTIFGHLITNIQPEPEA